MDAQQEVGLRRRAATSAAEGESQRATPSSSSTSTTRTPASEEGITWGFAFVALLFLRHFSARSNLIHDCDEVFNYWEPLHYLLYKSGFQTWEYSSEFALRSYLYLLLHALVAGPAAWWFGGGPRKVHVFYATRLALGFISAASEAALVSATSRRFGKRLAAYTLMLLCFSTGCSNSSTSFLPSTFSMYTITSATAALMSGRPLLAVIASVVGVLIGWPFSVLATAPLVGYAVLTGGFLRTLFVGVLTTVFILISSMLADRFFYGKWTLSILNLVMYNVFGDGDSSLYGVESKTFYLRNGFNNFNFALILALMLPIVMLLARRKKDFSLLVLASPIYTWLGFMSMQPHKEERFLYPVYTLICLAAAATIEMIPEMAFRGKRRSQDSTLFTALKIFRPVILGIILVISYSRTTSLLNGYSAPMKVLNYLPPATQNDTIVCIGSEWHRFPSSFFLPSPSYKVGWLDDGFNGLLPMPFNASIGGTAAAPPYFNKLNKASVEQFMTNEDACNYLLELDLHREGMQLRGSNRTLWEVIVELPFLDNERSPAIQRAFFFPWSWQSANKFGTYRLLKKKQAGF
ncbi:hypothetical protein GOP47_0006541 [Adiantum capillus-veneris]|uniref:Mannosyltransferase n=1 Tax=Adiantum capillus-veneris TaxID=13818 RepID=A0A9D4V329_ADICA|nr:hypothetical protein GOP47_0006541 [Adiantum capillus-veneris]